MKAKKLDSDEVSTTCRLDIFRGSCQRILMVLFRVIGGSISNLAESVWLISGSTHSKHCVSKEYSDVTANIRIIQIQISTVQLRNFDPI